MAVIIDLFTRKVLAVNPESVSALTVSVSPYTAIKERIEARFGDNLPAHFALAMNKPQAIPYKYGDPHNVKYRTKRYTFNKPMPVPCEVTEKSCTKVKGVLTLGSKCEQGIDEPFPWMDHKYQVALNFLKSLPDGTSLNIFTRSDLIAHDDYVTELKRLKATVYVLFASVDDETNRTNEPGAPSYKRRKMAVDKLREQGICSMLKFHEISEQVA